MRTPAQQEQFLNHGRFQLSSRQQLPDLDWLELPFDVVADGLGWFTIIPCLVLAGLAFLIPGKYSKT
jgi:hypothetical protein